MHKHIWQDTNHRQIVVCATCGVPAVKDEPLCSDPGCTNPATIGDTCGLHPHITFKPSA